MSDYVEITIKVPKGKAKYLENNKIFEIVLRDAKKRYMPFVDCLIVNNPHLDADKIYKVLQPTPLKGVKKQDIERTIHLARTIGRHVQVSDGTGKSVSQEMSGLVPRFEQILRLSNVKNLKSLNAGLTALNLAVTVTGFMVIGNKLNDMEKDMRKLDQLKDIELDKIHSTFHHLAMRFNSLSAKRRDRDEVDRDTLEEYLRDTNAFIRDRLMRAVQKGTFDKETTEQLLAMIWTLLPSYTLILCDFERSYYFEKHRIHDNHKTYMNLYEELQSEAFTARVHDHMFLEQKMHAEDALIAVTLQKILVNEQLIAVHDQMTLAQETGTEEEYMILDDIISESVRDYAQELVRQNAAEEDKEILLTAISSTCQAVCMPA